MQYGTCTSIYYVHVDTQLHIVDRLYMYSLSLLMSHSLPAVLFLVSLTHLTGERSV